MALPAPNLDDRRFQDIVDETKRMIPRFTPEWTNHNVSDPGVALIELFAWMSEMVLFRVNQVPEKLFVHFLDLVGIEPFPPSTARADLVFWLSAPATTEVSVRAGTEVATSATAADPVVFTTQADAVVVPPRLVAAHTTGATGATGATGTTGASVDRWDDLADPGATIPCFTSDPLAPGDALLLGFADPLAGLIVRLQVAARAAGIGVAPDDAPLAWEVWTGQAWARCRVYSDGTGGLNRDGDVVLVVPPLHAPVTLAGTAAHWLRVRLLAARPGQRGYEATPRVTTVRAQAVGVVVAAEHSQAVGREVLGRSTGTSGQRFAVAQAPVAARRDGEHVEVVTAHEVQAWEEVGDFSASGPKDRHVVWDSSTGQVCFGPSVRYPDGTSRQHGAVPPDGAEIAVSGYRHGGGTAGNVGARTLTVLRSGLPHVASVLNLDAAAGGVDAETVEEAKVRGPMTLRTGQRAVTAGDFERITREVSVEVARARCLPARDGRGAVRVLVVPQVRTDPATHVIDDFALPAPLLAAVSKALDLRRPVGVAVEVGTPFYQGVSVAVLLRGLPGRPAALVRQRALDVVARFVNPVTGGPDGAGWPFDGELTASGVGQLLEAVEGVERVEEVVLFEYDLRTRRRVGSGREALRPQPHGLFLSAAPQVVLR